MESLNMVKTVYNYLEEQFGGVLITRLSWQNIEDLKTMPLSSNCGKSCKKAIDTSIKFLDNLDPLTRKRSMIDKFTFDAVSDTVLIYICG
jgi:hypothetical protein